MSIVCFHNPDEENGFLSNWFLASFCLNDMKFSSVEQYMMYSKARCFKDIVVAEEIMKTNDLAIIKSLGRSVSHYDDAIWVKYVRKSFLMPLWQNSLKMLI